MDAPHSFKALRSSRSRIRYSSAYHVFRIRIPPSAFRVCHSSPLKARDCREAKGCRARRGGHASRAFCCSTNSTMAAKRRWRSRGGSGNWELSQFCRSFRCLPMWSQPSNRLVVLSLSREAAGVAKYLECSLDSITRELAKSLPHGQATSFGHNANTPTVPSRLTTMSSRKDLDPLRTVPCRSSSVKSYIVVSVHCDTLPGSHIDSPQVRELHT